MIQPGFIILEHPADLGIKACGTSLAQAFENVAYGLISLILDSNSIQLVKSRKISLAAGNYQQLLVRWLSEILFLYDGERFAPAELEIRELSPYRLLAQVRGTDFDSAIHETRLDVKAITYHQLLVNQIHGRFCVQIFLDI